MIAIKILKPRAGLAPASRRRAAAALGLALAAALRRVGRFERVEARAWRGVPDAAHIRGEEVDVGGGVDADVVDSIAEGFRRRRWDGLTLMLKGELGTAKLGVDVDIYASEYVPMKAGIAEEGVDVFAEPRGHVGDAVVESFYELFDVEYEKMRAVVEELVAEMKRVELKAATYAEARTYPLWRLAAKIYAMRGYSFSPEGAVPLWCRPWVRQMARHLYRLAPPGLRELAGPYGMAKIVRGAAPELLKYLAGRYDVKLHEDALQLIPLSVAHHREAAAELRDALAEAMKAALRMIKEKGRLDWEEYADALEEELRQRLKTPS